MENDLRLAKEIEIFTRVLEEGGVQSSIPPIFTYWATRYLGPRLDRVFGTSDIDDLFAVELGHSWIPGQPLRTLSLGSGDCSTEIAVVRILLSRGYDVRMTCTDLNPVVTAAAQDRAREAGVSHAMTFEAVNLNEEVLDGPFDGIMVNHSLHHFEGLEHLFDLVHSSLRPGGVFVVSDMIGRNGHMRWPEALPFVEALWDYLPDDKKHNRFARCIEPDFSNYDCTTDDPFEGIRAQDILPMLHDRFAFRRFVGYGNIPDVFVDRIYGDNFNPDDPRDTAFIDYCEALNTQLTHAGVIKPTMMFASLTNVPLDESCVYDAWSPAFSVRRPDQAE